ncbi:hypothetical protein F511_33842 [Dorcoceras hygrometricum]|uniref:Uncharacterized protein n=1 Tax=Dorcoceras hygrometricum TaxID=472368 RepID=A0A2Z7B453_9LAMI|nr:hypothetical protein F511_33842 [Dorcoceras hygrometricum]
MLNTLSSVSVLESRIQYLCDPQWLRDTASRGPTTIVAPESQFRTCPTDHDNIGYPRMSASGESSTTMHRLLHASGSHPIPPPNDPKTNQYNQDLGLIHSTNGNHLESTNEGSSIDHQVTIYLHMHRLLHASGSHPIPPPNDPKRSDQMKRFDKIVQQQVTVPKSTRVNATVARDWSNFEIQSKRWCWLQLEADARIQGSKRKRHVLVTITHMGTSSESSLRICWCMYLLVVSMSTGFDDVGATSLFYL